MSTSFENVRMLFTAAILAAGLTPAWSRAVHAEGQQPTWPAEGVEDFSFTECHGRTVTKADLLGQPWLASFIFTNCAGPCPLVSERMQMLQEKTKGLGVRLVSFTVDPERDTPEVLRAYAAHYRADPERWWFLTGDKADIYRVIRGSFKQIAGDALVPQPGFEIEHSITIMHVDAAGRVVGQYNARDDVDMARLRRALSGKSDPSDSRLIAEADANAKRQEQLQRQAEEAARAAEQAEEALGQAEEAALKRAGVPPWVWRLPAVNASLNGLATVLLLAGFSLIKAQRIEAHKTVMLSAFVTSALFLACYLVYHAALHRYTGSGSQHFQGTGAAAFVYFGILISHITLAIGVAVLAPLTIYRGLAGQWEKHRRLARVTFPIWLYVSVTGVIIYWMLYHGPHAAPR
ncbi:MAG: DUF420 domain-containing protein [Planctomycetaceae bacterium]